MGEYPIPSLRIEGFFGVDQLEITRMWQFNLFASEGRRGHSASATATSARKNPSVSARRPLR